MTENRIKVCDNTALIPDPVELTWDLYNHKFMGQEFPQIVTHVRGFKVSTIRDFVTTARFPYETMTTDPSDEIVDKDTYRFGNILEALEFHIGIVRRLQNEGAEQKST